MIIRIRIIRAFKMITFAALVLELSCFLGKFNLETLFTFFYYIDQVLIICIPSCFILDRRLRLRSCPTCMYVF